ncbi:hypothetical protein QU848_23475, partial [Escherichia coli]|nr:hypothetical protein [Escherichia coli]
MAKRIRASKIAPSQTKIVPGGTGSGITTINFSFRYIDAASLFRILCKCLFSEVTVQAVTELDNK